MDQNEFRTLKESGGLVDDAGLHDAETTITDDLEEEELEQEEETSEDQEQEEEETEDLEEADPEVDEEDDLPALTEKEKTAFEKRMEREKKKLQEKLEAEIESKYSRHKGVIDLLGGDPEAIERSIRENQIVADARRVADANGWDEDDTRYYIEQQKQQNELKELRVQMNINKLRDNPDYAGIGSMEKDIMSKIDKTNGALTVEEAYWALGGPKKAEQIRMEAQVRESEKRKKQPRTVLTDSQTATVTEKPLPSDVARDAQRMGISPAEARKLMNNPTAGNIDEWRATRNKAK